MNIGDNNLKVYAEKISAQYTEPSGGEEVLV